MNEYNRKFAQMYGIYRSVWLLQFDYFRPSLPFVLRAFFPLAHFLCHFQLGGFILMAGAKSSPYYIEGGNDWSQMHFVEGGGRKQTQQQQIRLAFQ